MLILRQMFSIVEAMKFEASKMHTKHSLKLFPECFQAQSNTDSSAKFYPCTLA